MGNDSTEASRWRIELAKELIEFYVPRDGIRMAVLSGSPPKGLSDDVLSLVEKHMPALADGYPDRRRAMAVRARPTKPAVRRRTGGA